MLGGIGLDWGESVPTKNIVNAFEGLFKVCMSVPLLMKSILNWLFLRQRHVDDDDGWWWIAKEGNRGRQARGAMSLQKSGGGSRWALKWDSGAPCRGILPLSRLLQRRSHYLKPANHLTISHSDSNYPRSGRVSPQAFQPDFCNKSSRWKDILLLSKKGNGGQVVISWVSVGNPQPGQLLPRGR